jgi:hypothetical protein
VRLDDDNPHGPLRFANSLILFGFPRGATAVPTWAVANKNGRRSARFIIP